MWPDYSVDYYIYRPDCLEDVSFYQFSENYQRITLSFHRMNNVDQNGMPILNDGELCFGQDHPGRRYYCIKNSKKNRIPKLSMPKGIICDLEDLELSEGNPSEQAIEKQENYAKVSLFLFYPF